jgi:rod shape-determining protein MreD
MWIRQVALCLTLLLLALMIQVTVLSRLGLPGATPDLLVVTLVALAFAYGPFTGVIAGFAAGIAFDLTPPSSGLFGINAIIYIVVGLLAGLADLDRDRSFIVLTGFAGVFAGGAALASAALDALFGSERVIWDQVPGIVLSSMLYAIVLAPFVIWLTGSVARKLTPELLV